MMNHQHVRRPNLHSACPLLFECANQRYYVEVPGVALGQQSQLVDQAIQFALEILGAHHLEVRVVGAANSAFDLIHES